MKLADQRARLHLAFWGLLHFKNSGQNAATRKNLFDTKTPKYRDDPHIMKAVVAAAWQRAYVRRLVEDGILKTIRDKEAIVYTINDRARVSIMLDDVEGMGAERFGWYISPKEAPYPWKDEPEVEEFDDKYLNEERVPEESDESLVGEMSPEEPEEKTPDSHKRSYGALVTSQLEIQKRMLRLLTEAEKSRKQFEKSVNKTLGKAISAVDHLNNSTKSLVDKLDAVTDSHLSKVMEKAAEALGPLVQEELKAAGKAIVDSASATKEVLKKTESILSTQEAAQQDRVGSVAKVLLEKAEDLGSRSSDLKAMAEMLLEQVGSDGNEE